LSGNLNVASIAGTLAEGGWDVNGNARVVVAKAVANSWSGNVLGTLTTMVVRTGGMPAPLQGGVLTTLNVLSGDITGSISVNSAHLIRTAGAIMNSTIASSGDIFAILAASISGSQITAGNVTQTFTGASSTADLGSNKITVFRLTSLAANAFSNSTVMARTITTSVLGSVDTSQVGGLAAGTFSSVSLKIGATNEHLGPLQLGTPGDITSANGVSFGSVKIRVLP
jgi:hypothetical protein